MVTVYTQTNSAGNLIGGRELQPGEKYYVDSATGKYTTFPTSSGARTYDPYLSAGGYHYVERKASGGEGYYSQEAQAAGNKPAPSGGTTETIIQDERAYEVKKDAYGNVLNVSNVPTPEPTRTTKQFNTQLTPSEIAAQQKTQVGSIIPFSQAAQQKKILESPTAVHTSTEFYANAVEQHRATTGKEGGNLTSLESILVPIKTSPKPGEYGYHGTKERPQGLFNPKTELEKIPLFDEETGKPNIRFEGETPAPEFKRDSKYGLMIREDIAARNIIPRELQSNIDASKYYLTPIAKIAQEFTQKSAKSIEEYSGYSPESNIAKKFAVGAAEGLASLPEFGAVTALGGEAILRNILRPKEVAKVAGAGAILTFGGLEQGLSKKPVETLGMLFAMKKAGDIGGKLYSKSPVKTGKVEVPVSGVEKVAQVWKGIYSDVKGAKPIVGLGKSLERIGIKLPDTRASFKGAKYYKLGEAPEVEVLNIPKPNVIVGQPKPSQIPDIIPEGGFTPTTNIETSILAHQDIMRKFGFSDLEIEKVTVGKEIMALTEKQPSKFMEKEYVRETGTLSPKGVNEVLDFVKEHKKQVDQLYGSFSARPQLKPEYRRVPGDIDIQLSVPEAEAAIFTEKLAAKLKKSGENVRVSAERKTLIEAKVTPDKWAHALDIHFKDEPITDALTPTDVEGSYGFAFGQKPIKIESIKSMRLSEQGLRKGKSSLTWQAGGKVAPKPHRLKDISDFYTVQKTLLESRGKGVLGKLRKGSVSRGEQLLKRWQELYPEIDWEAVKGDVKVPLALEKNGKLLTGVGAASTAVLLSSGGAAKPITSMNLNNTERRTMEPSTSVNQPSRPIKSSVPVKSYTVEVSRAIKKLSSSLYTKVPKSISVSKSLPPSRSKSSLSSGKQQSPVSRSLPAQYQRRTQSPSNIYKIERVLSPSKPVSTKQFYKSPPSKSPGKRATYTYPKTIPRKVSPPVSYSKPTRTPNTPQTIKRFKDALGDLGRTKKGKKGKYNWKIKNQVPTLESLLGEG